MKVERKKKEMKKRKQWQNALRGLFLPFLSAFFSFFAIIFVSVFIFIFISSFVVSINLYAFEGELSLLDVKFDCQDKFGCSNFEEEFKKLIGENFNRISLNEALKRVLEKLPVDKFSYELENVAKSSHEKILKLSLSLKEIISSISFSYDYPWDSLEFESNFLFKEGDLFDSRIISQMRQYTQRSLQERGLYVEDILIHHLSSEKGEDLKVEVKFSKKALVSQVRFTSLEDSDCMRSFKSLESYPYDPHTLSELVRDCKEEMFSRGYFFASVETKAFALENIGFVIDVDIKSKDRYLMNFSGNNHASHRELLEIVQREAKRFEDDLDIRALSHAIETFYLERGLWGTKVSIDLRETFGRRDYFFTISEGKKVPISSLSFLGNAALTFDEIESFYDEHATSLSAAGYLDRLYLETFEKILNRTYLERGYVFAKVDPVRIIFDDQDHSAKVEFRIREHNMAKIKDFTLENVPEELVAMANKGVANKKGLSFNALTFDADLDTILFNFQERGYFQAKILNRDLSDIVTYSKDYTEVSLRPRFDLGKEFILDSILINGNKITSKEVIEREIFTKRGEYLTPRRIQELRNRLMELNLFSEVEMQVLALDLATNKNQAFANLLIIVHEREFGLIEVSPGVRTDLGPKVSTSISYNNLFGLNQTVSAKAQVNRRFDNELLDFKRSGNARKIEYSLEAHYLNPWFLSRKLEFEAMSSFSRKRLYAFDADILKSLVQWSWDLSTWINVSFAYQFEYIVQYDASELGNNGYYQIGSLLPTLSFDSRDNRLNPQKGTHFLLSLEFANPFFGSMKKRGEEINFYRVVSQNRLYMPLTRRLGLAASLSLGLEQNLSDGKIPSIKVFRLDGLDYVSGFSDGEINRIDYDQDLDISEIDIRDKAYFLNFKLFPRYQLSDNSYFGPFLNIGRVFVDKIDFGSMRYSAGLSFRFVSPVGPLDFEYGVKLDRKMRSSVDESFGRLHFVIGNF